jgi:hypothetical protein
MKKTILLLLLLTIFQFGYAQEKPVTQTEYVKMLYSLQKNPGGAAAIVDALRRRGINFPLTDGLRGLTRSKSSNNEELKRTIEEAERRRQNPDITKLPSVKDADTILEKTRENTLALLADMPDFVVKQLITRSEAYAGTGNWRPYDNLIIAVSYSTERGEQYKVLSKNGVQVNTETSNNYNGLDGATSGGEFVEDLKKIFKPESKTQFELLTTDLQRNRKSVVFQYEIAIENNKDGGVGLKGANYQSSPAGEKGRIWIDREDFRVLRIEYQLTDIAPTFPVKAVTKFIDYDQVEIAGEKYLLPILSDFRGTVESSNKRFESRNVIRFKNYQKFGTEVKVVEEDSEPVPEEKPNE